MAVGIAIGATVVALFVLWVAVAREPGPSAEETAVAYELAWNRGDFSTLFDLSGLELRDGLQRFEFVAAKRSSVAARVLHPEAAVRARAVDSSGDVAHVITAVEVDGGVVESDVVLNRSQGQWRVVDYSLRLDDATTKPTSGRGEGASGSAP